jgi:hypothetical protein
MIVLHWLIFGMVKGLRPRYKLNRTAVNLFISSIPPDLSVALLTTPKLEMQNLGRNSARRYPHARTEAYSVSLSEYASQLGCDGKTRSDIDQI